MQRYMKGQATLIIYGVIAVVGLLVLHGFDMSRQKIGEERERKLLQPQIDAAKTATTQAEAGRDAALAANKGLQANLQTLSTERDACNTSVEKLRQQGVRLQVQRQARKPVDDKKIYDISVEQQELIAALGLADKGGTCEQQLARSTALWKKMQQQRTRDYPRPAGLTSEPPDVTIKAPK